MSIVVDIPGLLMRLKAVLPVRWFADDTPILDAVLTGVASAWVEAFALLNIVNQQSRIETASGIFLDIAAQDYFGSTLTRRAAEADVAYSARIQQHLVRTRATRVGVIQALQDLTGRTPVVFEPRNPVDTGVYNVNMGYGVSGGYGSMAMPYQFLVQARRPDGLPVSNGSGYAVGPGGYNTAPAFYADVVEFQGNISDAEIYASIAAVVPTTAIAWTNISN
jgi:hypothetical protein